MSGEREEGELDRNRATTGPFIRDSQLESPLGRRISVLPFLDIPLVRSVSPNRHIFYTPS